MVATHCNRKYSLNENAFDVIDEGAAWVLGMIVSDGCLHRAPGEPFRGISWDLHIKDIDVLEKINRFLSSSKPIYTFTRKSSGCTKNSMQHVARLNICSVKLCKKVHALGVGFAKSLNERWLTCIPKRMHRHFIGGILAGDGSVRFDRDHRAAASICGSKDVVTAIAGIFPRQRANVYERSGLWIITYNSRDALDFLRWLYEPLPKYFMDRKYKKYIEMKEHYEKMDRNKKCAA